MHHTDYSQELRNAERKTLKNSPPNVASANSSETASKELLYAGIAAILVLVSLFNMDPANAQSDFEPGFEPIGYGTLVFNSAAKPERIKPMTSELSAIVSDQGTNLRIEQSFTPHPKLRKDALYTVSLPVDAIVMNSSVESYPCAQCDMNTDKMNVYKTRFLQHWTASVPSIASNNEIRIKLDILIAEEPPRRHNDFREPTALQTTHSTQASHKTQTRAPIISIRAALASIGSLASGYTTGVVPSTKPN